jgi:hypothetical protein
MRQGGWVLDPQTATALGVAAAQGLLFNCDLVSAIALTEPEAVKGNPIWPPSPLAFGEDQEAAVPIASEIEPPHQNLPLSAFQ